MRENLGWSTSAGRWFGMPVRVHLFLVLFFAVILGIELSSGSLVQPIAIGTGIVTIAVVLVCVIAHELAHWYAVTNLGGYVSRWTLLPWGGGSDFELEDRSERANFVAHAAGPFANGVLFSLGATLLIQAGESSLADLTNPFRPHAFHFETSAASIMKIATWVNFQLLFVNLMPCFPFDGAAMMRSLIRLANESLPQIRVESAIMVMGHACAFTMIGLSLLIREYSLGPIPSGWMLMTLAGIMLFYSARFAFFDQMKFPSDEWDENAAGSPDYLDSIYEEISRLEDEDFHDDFDSDFDNGQSSQMPYSQWLTEKQEARLQREQALEQSEDQLADEVLEKLHGDGLDSLSDDERDLLSRVSERLRRKRGANVDA
jgi:Zn-dependent protease